MNGNSKLTSFSPPLVIPKGTTKTFSVLVKGQPPFFPVYRTDVELDRIAHERTLTKLNAGFSKLWDEFNSLMAELRGPRRMKYDMWVKRVETIEARIADLQTALRLTGEQIAREWSKVSPPQPIEA